MKYFSHLNTAVHILGLYDGKIPFHHFIKEYFRADKKYGSKDRKNISRLCYVSLRLGKAFPKWSAENRIRAGLFLCTGTADPVTEQLIGDYNELIGHPVQQKWQVISASYRDEFRDADATDSSDVPGKQTTIGHAINMSRLDAGDTIAVGSPFMIFPVSTNELSAGIDKDKYLYSFFTQPDLFLRIRPGKDEIAEKKLLAAGIGYELLPPSTIRLPITTKLDDVFVPDKDVVIQDYSSQLTASLFQHIKTRIKTVWDACAASGGKSLMAADYMPGIKLTVTDIRESVIANLEKRFKDAGIVNYRSYIADLTSTADLPFNDTVDLVIADVPCSGSGTWSRTPEQLSFFQHRSLQGFQSLQQNILMAIVPRIKPSGFLLYITCSAFAKENEDNCEFLIEKLQLKMIEKKMIAGYNHRADTMFAAIFQKIDG
jgi:16S rRNA (cytosine967-C5)-methyltransferase